MEDAQPHLSMKVLVTAAEAFPELERLFLRTQERLAIGFRIFDPCTRLHSPEGLAVGKDWYDLVVHTLARGVRLDFVLSDFDPIVRPDYHQRATRCHRLLLAAGEVSGRPDLLRVVAAIHPAKVGWLPSMILWPRARTYLLKTVREINELRPHIRRHRRRELPLLAPYLSDHPERRVRLRDLRLPRLTPVTHHQKIAVSDGRFLYVGGLDLNDRRWDTLDHALPGEETWHDLQVLVEGRAAEEAERHIHTFLAAVAGEEEPPALPTLLRTLSRKRSLDLPFLSPMPLLSELADAHDARSLAARRFIYLESQFFRDTRYARTLAQAARRNPDLGFVLILPAAPEDVAFKGNDGSDARYGEYLQARCIRTIRRAFGPRLFVGSPAQRRPAGDDEQGRARLYGSPLIYLHAKVSIFDDDVAIVSSANLNGRSLRWDTETGITLTDRAQVDDLRRRCTAHWLGGTLDEAFLDTETALEAWRSTARSDARAAPEDRRGLILPYTAAPARRFGFNLPGIPEEMV